MPLHLGDDPARMGPARRLVPKALVEPLHVVRRSADRTLEQMADALLRYLVCGQADRVFDPFSLHELIHVGLSESSVASKGDAFHRSSVARNDRLEHMLPSVGAVNVPRAKCAPFQITILVEDEERMIARTARSTCSALARR